LEARRDNFPARRNHRTARYIGLAIRNPIQRFALARLAINRSKRIAILLALRRCAVFSQPPGRIHIADQTAILPSLLFAIHGANPISPGGQLCDTLVV
jgi:hypothetical protein